MLILGVLIVFLAALVSLVGGVMFTVAAFRVSLAWGLLVLFVPFAGLVFLVKYWPEAKRGFLISVGGSAGAIAAAILITVSGAAKARAASLAALQQAQPRIDPAAVALTTNPGRAAARRAPGEAQPAATPAPTPASTPTQRPAASSSAALDSSSSGALDVLRLRPPAGFEIPTPRADDAPLRVGQQLVFIGKDGRSFRGKLLTIDPDSYKIERNVAGGTLRYAIARADIREVRREQ